MFALLFLFLSLNAVSAAQWKLVWHDEFNTNGPPNPANWKDEHGFVRNRELQWYQSANAFCTNGLLVIEARRVHRRNPDFSPGSRNWRTRRRWIDYTSACLTTRGRHQFTYGKIEMRARIDTRTGSWPAFWMLGARPGRRWPACGEVDIMEFYSNNVLANFGYQLDGRTKWLAVKDPLADVGGRAWSKRFHTWTLIWSRQKMDLLLDGRLMNHLDLSTVADADGGDPFRHPAYLLLDLAIGANGGDPSHTQFPVRFEVDWVRVYRRVR